MPTGTLICVCCSAIITEALHPCNFDIINYIDDILGICVTSKLGASFDTLCKLLHDLRFQISEKKLVSPQLVLTVLASWCNTKNYFIHSS